jgi:multidrug resistance protein
MFERLGYPIEADEGGKSSSALIGVMIALFGVGILISSPIYGIISDKYSNRQWPMIAGLALQIVAILAFMWANSLGLLYFARFMQGVAGASIWVVGLAFVSDIFPEHELGRAMGTVFIGLNIGATIGPVLGGVLAQYLGYQAPFIFNCIVLAIDLFLRLLVLF